MKFRKGTTNDIPELWALRTRCVRETCSSHYPPHIIAPWSASPPPPQYPGLFTDGGCVVAEGDNHELLGFGVFDASANEVDALFVSPEHGGKHVGQALIRQLLALSDPKRSVVLSASLNAVSFYERQGFIADGEELYPHPSGIHLAAVKMHRR